MKASRKFPAIAYTIICIILLLGLLSGIGWLTNFSKYRSTYSDSTDKDSKSTTNTYMLNSDAKSFKIEALFGIVKINSTNEKPYIKTVSQYHIDFNINNQDDVCSIKLETDYNINTKFITNLFKNNKAPQIDIYLPKDMLGKVSVATNAGKLEINDIKADTLDVNVSAGDVKIKNCEFTNVKTELNAGKLVLYANNGIKSIESTVAAGTMDLYLPESIDGFNCSFNVAADDVDNKTDFDVNESQSGAIVSKNGRITYGDESCSIALSVSAGNIDILDY